MLPFERILCPTDFTDTSRDAVVAAAELASYFHARLVLLHVVPAVPVIASPMDGTGAGTVPANVGDAATRREAEVRLAEMSRELVPPIVDLRLVVESGDPAEAILGTAERFETDALVIATQGRTGWRRFLFGSVAERVVRCAEVPVITIHGASRERPGRDARSSEAVEA